MTRPHSGFREQLTDTAADAWFKQALLVGKATSMVRRFEAQAARLPRSSARMTARQLVKMLESTAKGLAGGEFRGRVDSLIRRSKRAGGP